MLYISFFALLFASILGIVTLLNVVYDALLDKITDRKIVLNSENCNQTEYLIRSSLAKNDGDILVIDEGISQDAVEILVHLQNESGRIIISSMNNN